MKDDPLTKLEEVQRKVSAYYRKHPGADHLPAKLAQELADRTRDYVEYQERRRQPIT